MLDGVMRDYKEKTLVPVARYVSSSVHPNHVSLAALVVGLGSVWAVTQGQYGAGLALWAGNRMLDGLDGVVARQQGTQSDFGGYLDLLLDFIIYLTVPLAFIVAQPSQAALWAGIFLIGSYVLNNISWAVLSAILEKRAWRASQAGGGKKFTTVEIPTGLIEGTETVIFYSLFFLLPDQITWLFALMAVLVLVTVVQRVAWAWRTLD
jgi:phosphatidylglycerophosphate synthase